MKKSVVGKLIYVQSAPNGTGYYFELENGDFLDIQFLCDEQEALKVPRNTRISLVLLGDTIDGLYQVSDEAPMYTILRDNL